MILTTEASVTSAKPEVKSCPYTMAPVDQPCTYRFFLNSAIPDPLFGFSLDFGDGTVLTSGIVSPLNSFINNSAGSYTTGYWSNIYHVYQTDGVFTPTLNFSYIDNNGSFVEVSCTFDVIDVKACDTSKECDFTATAKVECARLSIDITTNSTVLQAHKYIIKNGSDVIQIINTSAGSVNIALENVNLCSGTLEVIHEIYGPKGEIVCSSSQFVDVPNGIYIGNLDCFPIELAYITGPGKLLPNSGYSGGCPLYITGELIINEDYYFDYSTLFFGDAAGMTIKKTSPVPPSVELSAENTVMTSACEVLWRGVEVYDNTKIDMDVSSIDNALYAIRAINTDPMVSVPPQMELTGVTFSNNFVGILAVDGAIGLDTDKFTGNTFNGGVLHKLGGQACPSGLVSILSNTPIGERAYAGIYIDGHGDNNLGAQIHLKPNTYNTFAGLSVGIGSRNADCTIQSCTFGFIDNFGYGGLPDVDAGHGIDFNYGSGGRKLTVTDCFFRTVRRGIVANSLAGSTTDVTIHNNDMINMGGGISINSDNGVNSEGQPWSGDFNTVSILDNDIALEQQFYSEGGVGIFIKDHTNSFSRYFIDDNTITSNSENSIGIWMLTAEGNPSGFVGSDPDLINNIAHGNLIVMNKRGSGIVQQLTPFMSTLHNDITLHHESGFGIDARGVQIPISSAWLSVFRCNTVEDVSATTNGWSQAYSFNSIAYPDINNNRSINATVGMQFRGVCANSFIRQNKMGIPGGSMRRGLSYSYAFTGPQYSTGNRWFGTFTEAGARNSGPLTGSIYFVAAGDNQHPGSIEPSFGWFLGGAHTEIEHCAEVEEDNSLPIMGLTDYEYQYMVDNSNMGHAGLDWDFRTHILSVILDSIELLNDPVVQNFYSDPNNVEILSMMDLKSEAKAVFDYNTDVIAAILEQISYTEASIATLDASLALDPTNTTLQLQRSQQLTLLTQQQQLYQNIWNATLVNISNSAEQTIASFMSFQTSSIPAEFTKKSWIAYLKQKGKGHSFSTAELNELKDIALTCPELGSSVVHFASAIYSGMTEIPLPVSACEEDTKNGKIEFKGSNTVQSNSDFALYPNPGRNELNISVNHELTYRVEIMTLTGKKMRTQTSSELQTSINTSSLSEGMYMIHVFSEDGQLNSTMRWIKSK